MMTELRVFVGRKVYTLIYGKCVRGTLCMQVHRISIFVFVMGFFVVCV